MMIKRMIPVLGLIALMSSCLSDIENDVKIEYVDITYQNKIVIDSIGRPVLITRDDSNAVTVKTWEYVYDSSLVEMKVFDVSNELIQHKVYELDTFSSVAYSFDTVFTDEGFLSYMTTYQYSDSGLIPNLKLIQGAEVQYGSVVSTGALEVYYAMISSTILEEANFDAFYGTCYNYTYFNDTLTMKFDVINPLSFLENMNFGIVPARVYHSVGCSVGNPAETAFGYEFNEDGYVSSMAVIYMPEFYNQSLFTITRTFNLYEYIFE